MESPFKLKAGTGPLVNSSSVSSSSSSSFPLAGSTGSLVFGAEAAPELDVGSEGSSDYSASSDSSSVASSFALPKSEEDQQFENEQPARSESPFRRIFNPFRKKR